MSRPIKHSHRIEYVKSDTGLPVKLIPELNEMDYLRFWSKAELTSDINTCWNWKGWVQSPKKPYGQFAISNKTYCAHRIAYFIYNNEDPGSLGVLHKCDNHRCVNPNHLFLGTNNDNIQDKVKKGRWKGRPIGFKQEEESKLRGIKNHSAKLTEKDVLEIRNIYSKNKIGFFKISKMYSVSKKLILNIVHRRAWTHI